MAQRSRRDKKALNTRGEKKARARRFKRVKLPYGRKNYLFFGVGSAFAVIGFIFLAAGDTVFSTILLTLGYVVLIPVGLYLEPRS